MKNLTRTWLTLTGVLTLSVTSALAQPFPNQRWNIDENGPALLGGGSLAGYSNGTNKLDPVSGMMGWYYQLGTAIQPGDVILLEPPGPQNTNGIPSDLLRFDGNGVFFFSDLEAGEIPDHADVPGIPNAINPVFVGEVGPEGNNGVLYIPGPGQPGFYTSGIFPGIQYNFISDVPEPGTAVLFLAGAGLLLSRRFNHK